MATRLVQVIPLDQFIKNCRVFTLRNDPFNHLCSKCHQEIDPNTNYYSATWLHSGLGSVNVPDMYHVDCVVMEVG